MDFCMTGADTTTESQRRPSSAAVAMERQGSRGLAYPLISTMTADGLIESQKRSSNLSRTHISPLQGTEDTKPLPTPRSQHPGISRTPSTATVTQSHTFATGPRPPSQAYSTTAQNSKRQVDITTYVDESAVSNDGTSESETESQTSYRQLPRRSVSTKKPPLGTLSSDGDADDDDDEDGEGFLPFAARPDDDDEDNEPTATLVSPSHQRTSTAAHTRSGHYNTEPQDSSASSTTSSQPRAATNPARNHTNVSSPDTLSPQQRAQLSRLSPRYRNVVSGSEGSPSMGSSFSDLDDLSVTQSAMQDALVSRMQHGGSIGMGLGSLIGRGRVRRDRGGDERENRNE